MDNDQIFLYFLIFFLAANSVSFLVMMADKAKSIQSDSKRISEGMMFFLAAAFGSVGVYLGMFFFRHKTQKWYFLIGIPLLMLENAATLYFGYLFWTGI